MLAVFALSCGETVVLNEPRVRHDFNGDGIADVLVGVGFDGTIAGAAYVFYGSTLLASSIDASSASVKLVGETLEDYFGLNVSGAGDVNDDGIDDIIIGAPYEEEGGANAGAAYVFYGSGNLDVSINASAADVKLISEDGGDNLGYRVSEAGDVNNDGIDDVIVGAKSEGTGGTNAGAAYIFYGGNLAASINASAADVKIVGEAASDQFSFSVSDAGDVNNDGIDDVIVGARGENSNQGAAYILYGSTSLASSIDASGVNVKLIGEDDDDRFGRSVSGVGDIDNDGIDDVIVGADQDDDGDSTSGVAFIFYGSTSLALSIDASAANVKLIGEDSGDRFGYSVSGGDVNDDGIVDVIVGARGDDTSQGAAYIFYGGNLASSIDVSAANVKLVGADANDQFGWSVSGGGDVNNDGIADVVVGAYTDDDSGRTDSGSVFIFYGSASLASSIDASVANVTLIGEGASDFFGYSVSASGP